MTRIIFFVLLGWAVLVGIYTFILCGIDKRRALREEWRVPERRFFLLSLFGGALGLGLGMLTFHHKTRHVTFFLAVIAGFAIWGTILFVAAAKCFI